MQRRTFLLFFGLLIALPVISITPIFSQNNETIITLSVQDWQRDSFSADLFEDFEAANPGVKVVIVSPSSSGFVSAPGAVEEHLDGVAALVSTADVIAIQSWYMSVESTRAGYYLDLMPLIQQDTDFNTDDFFPGVWGAYQWDRGVWAIPTSVNIEMLVYDANAFDAAGLSYPDASWTLDDLANAARVLTQRDPAGNVVVPGFSTWDPLGMMHSLLGTGFYDDSVVPSEPRLDTPEIQAFIDTYTALLDEGVIQSFGEFDRNVVPMIIEGPWRLGGFGMPTDPDRNWKGALLPGGGASLSVEGLAVSAGTDNPELAYELIKYLTTRPELTYRFGGTPIRRSMVGVEPEEEGTFFLPEYPEEVQALIDQALESGYAYGEQRFGEYIAPLLQRFPGQDLSAFGTLAEQQQAALDNLEAAAARRGSQAVVVATPVPTPVIQAGETVIRFRLEVPYSPLPNRERWDQLIAEFVAEDPTVGNVDLISGFGGGPGEEEQPDCYYASGNRVPSLDLTTVLSLDPLMSADLDFDGDDFLAGAITQVTRDNQVWAYPVSVSPFLLSYSAVQFEEAGVPLPAAGWTIDAFLDALNQLKAHDPSANYVFQSDFGNTHILMLAAAFGGLPIDYSTTPPTLNLTDPTVIDAVRQTLDLARNGLMSYTRLDNSSGGGGGGDIPIRSASGASLAFSLGYQLSDDFVDSVNLEGYVTYPQGSTYIPATYSLGAGYINADALSPEACYNFIKKIANTPDLVLGIPVRRSQLDDPALDNLIGPSIAQTFRDFAATFDAPNVVVMQDPNSFSGGIGTYVESIWLNQAFDAYVLDDGDLETGLAEAQRYIEEYRACVPEDESPDITTMSTEEVQSYFEQFTDCAVSIDPRLEPRFNFGGDDE